MKFKAPDLTDPDTLEKLQSISDTVNKWIRIISIQILNIPLEKMTVQKNEEGKDALDKFMSMVIVTTLLSFSVAIAVFSLALAIDVFAGQASPWLLFAEPIFGLINVILLANTFSLWRNGITLEATDDDDN